MEGQAEVTRAALAQDSAHLKLKKHPKSSVHCSGGNEAEGFEKSAQGELAVDGEGCYAQAGVRARSPRMPKQPHSMAVKGAHGHFLGPERKLEPTSHGIKGTYHGFLGPEHTTRAPQLVLRALITFFRTQSTL